MTKSIKTLTLLALVILMSSFTKTDINHLIGTYAGSAADPAQIKLTIHADHTFYYQDFSDSNKKLIVKGNWKTKGNKIVLMDKDTKFHNVWTFDKDGKVAKSHKGLSFYRLCKVD